MCLFEHWHSFGSCIVVVYTFFFLAFAPKSYLNVYVLEVPGSALS